MILEIKSLVHLKKNDIHPIKFSLSATNLLRLELEPE